AEAPQLASAITFLREARALQQAPDAVRVFDPVPHVLTRRSGFERAQLVMQSASRSALQAHLAALGAQLYETAPRGIRWHLDVDPIEFD
ncbi:MAG TPA: primosomal protein N', partial [Burkholderiales bacterium]|nr:primosomal protein N' [Burkholderiales bacterium]